MSDIMKRNHLYLSEKELIYKDSLDRKVDNLSK